MDKKNLLLYLSCLFIYIYNFTLQLYHSLIEAFELKKKVKKNFTTVGKSLETLNYEARLHLKTLNQLFLPGGTRSLCK